jgi:hypothetical protein
MHGLRNIVTLHVAVNSLRIRIEAGYEMRILWDETVQTIKLKLNLFHYTPRRRMEERRYSSYSFPTSSLDGGEWSASRPGRALAPGKGPPVPVVQEAGWAPQLVRTQRLEEKSFCLYRGSKFNRLVLQPVARHWTDWGTRLANKE